MDIALQELLIQFFKSQNELNKADEQIKKLKNEIKNELKNEIKNENKFYKLEEENKNLKSVLKINKDDIIDYKKQMNELIQKQKENENELIKLKKEINESKKEKSKKDEKIKKINTIKELRNTLKLKLFKKIVDKDSNISNEINNNINDKNVNNKIKNIEELQTKKTNYELQFIELKKKCNEYHINIEQQKEIVDNYKQYINEIHQQMNIFNEQLNISVSNNNDSDNDNNNAINNPNKKKIDEIYDQINIVSVGMAELDEIIFNINNIFGENIENLMNEINNNLIKIDKKEYKDEITLKSLIEKIRNIIEETQNICFIFNEKNNNFCNVNHNVEEEMNKLKNLYTQYGEEYKKNKNKNNSNNKNKLNNNNKESRDSFKFGIKEQNIKSESYKTALLFNNNGEDDNIEFYLLEESKILRKNWHEICYIYDDYDIHDIYYDIKAVGLSNNQYFKTTSYGFKCNSIIEIELFLVNNIPIKYIQKNHRIEFNIKLYNLETAKVHIIYKEFKDLSKYSQGKIEERKLYRNEYYGLDKSLAGQMAKFCLILKGSFDIVNFKDYFLVRNEKNKNEIEYVWGGRVPYEGKKTLIRFSKSEAVWSFKYTLNFHSNQNIKNTTLKIPIEFIGGNNEILNIKTSSPQTSNIILDEENRE